MFVTDQGKLYGWGYNSDYELGNGGNTNTTATILVSVYGSLVTRGVVLGACGSYHTVALASDGTLHAWGQNNYGQLGTTGGTTSATIPTMVNNGTGQLAGSRTAAAVACGGVYTVAIATDGTLHAWGTNNNGQLGTGGTTNAYIPTMVNNATGLLAGGRLAAAVACGFNHTVALASDGTLHTWGYNGYGQLGTSTGGTANAYLPTIVNNGTGLLAGSRLAAAVACGGNHTVALASDGTVHSWGLNTNGQLGTGGAVNVTIPTIINNGTGLLAGGRSATAVVCGSTHTVALASDGTLHAWGTNNNGQLGTSTGGTANASIPTMVNNGTGLLAGSRSAATVACGGNHTVALATDGTLHAWGLNTNGQLGTGDTTNCFIPTIININAVAATTLFLNFTGQHRCFVDGHGVDTLPSLEGRIVCASKNQYITTSGPGGGDTAFQVDADAITTNDALPVVALSTRAKDKSAFGVVSLVANFEDRNATLDGADPAATLARLREQGDVRAEINSVGEGALWVCDAARDADTGLPVPLESGDLVTTSAVPGYGMRQDDDLWHGYTVAKITMDCDFDPPLVPVRRLLKDAMGNNVVDPATGKPVFEVVTDATAAADAADPPVPRLKPAYRLRYLRADGTDLADRAAYDAAAAAGEAVHLAAFVGCTYHC
jgi:alpha-tubulin suppressor-like RCC1 family protein